MKALRIVVPLILGAVAGGINFYVVQGMVAPLELTAVGAGVKAGDEIKDASMLVKVQVRADRPDIFKSAIPWSERGVVLNRRVNRPLGANEVLLFADVKAEGTDDIQALLKGTKDMSFTFPVRAARVVPGLRSGNAVAVIVSDGADPAGGRRVLGPFRLLSLGERPEPLRSGEEVRKVTVAVTPAKDGTLPPDAALLDVAASPAADGSDRKPRVVAVEFSAAQ